MVKCWLQTKHLLVLAPAQQVFFTDAERARKNDDCCKYYTRASDIRNFRKPNQGCDNLLFNLNYNSLPRDTLITLSLSPSALYKLILVLSNFIEGASFKYENMAILISCVRACYFDCVSNTSCCRQLFKIFRSPDLICG